ncbi:PREDICTED: S-adenosylmethionine mitochondrial carrier protein-like, partial [Galeopterus variegatus]|uniref:Mitochondrial S-adenosylmethionine carrier protein n=1 Tax=Galeopterus variegatus TaxID=482537 RepID=A0ABM0S6G4_GALVR
MSIGTLEQSPSVPGVALQFLHGGEVHGAGVGSGLRLEGLGVACLIRVPSEVVKQRAQVSASSRTFHIFSNILREEGIRGLYRGYKSTVLREIPFSLVQFPLWESLKALWSWRQDHVVDSWQSAVCGAFAGGFAAAVTTPLDVAKTRIMLAKAGSSTASGNVFSALHEVWRSQGLAG